MNIENYLDGRKGLRSILRFNMEYRIKEQSIADHSYHVATMFYIACKELNEEISSKDMFLVLNHDFVESITGDLNRRVKERNSATSKAWDVIESEVVGESLSHLTELQLRTCLGQRKLSIMKWCDTMDALLFCIEECRMGNKFLEEPKSFCRKSIISQMEDNCLKQLNPLYRTILTHYEEV